MIALTLTIRLILIKTNLAQNDMQKQMTDMQPKLQEIQEKYKDDPKKLSDETMKILKTHG
ncbi:MAG: YidC/Oxa1 family membrane protein insertase [Patescibacteria group bacterium]